MNKKVQNFIYSNPKRMVKFMSMMKASFWDEKGKERALNTFKLASEKVPAYLDYLNKNDIDAAKIDSFGAFLRHVPVCDKESYLSKYDIKMLSAGKPEECYTMCNSGGSTGKPLYTLNSRENLTKSYMGMHAFFEYFWDIYSQKKKVLFIDAMAMGMWTGGVLAEFIMKNLATDHKTYSHISPGADPEKIVDCIEKLGESYDIVFIATYPTLFKAVIDNADRRELEWPKYDIKLCCSGEMIDNALHDMFMERIGKGEGDITRIFDLYGGTEIGIPGYSFPITNIIKKLTASNKDLSRKIFGNEENAGRLFQTNPVNALVESIDGNLVVTYQEKVPILRYDIHDVGNVISWDEMMGILKTQKIDIRKELAKEGFHKAPFKWPFITFIRRQDWAITFYGAKIAPQSLQTVFAEDSRIYTFKISEYDDNGEFRFTVNLCMQHGLEIGDKEEQEMKDHYRKSVLNYLTTTNFDFKDAHSIDNKAMNPKILVYPYCEGPFTGMENKKSRLV